MKKFKWVLGAALAAVIGVSYANVALVTGPQDPSSLTASLNSLINAFNAFVNAGGGVAGVASFNARTGVVTPQTGDYAFSQLSGSVAGSQMPAFSGDATSSAGATVLTLATVNSNTGSCGDSTHVCQVTLDGKGRATAASAVAISGGGGGITALTGDVTASGSGSVATTLATVNTNTGTFGDSTHVAQITVNGKGLITAVSNVAVSGGGGGTPCTTTALSVQYNNAGSFGCVSGVTSDATAMIFADGDLKLSGSSSGTSILKAPATGGGTATLFAGSDTIAGLGTKQTWTAQQSNTVTTLSISTVTFTPTGASNNYSITLVHASCPCTLANPSATPVAGTSGIIVVNQSATGGDTIGTWGSDYIYPSGTTNIAFSTGASAIDVLAYYVIDSTHILLTTGALNASH